MTKFVYDKQAIIEVDALRWVKKSDVQSYLGEKRMEYWLEIDYRAATGTIKYENRRERDAMFNKICKAALPRKKKSR